MVQRSDRLVHGAVDDLSLQLSRQVDEVCAVAADANQQVLVLIRVLQSILQLLCGVDVELDVPAFALHEGTDQLSQLLLLLLVVQQALAELHVHGVADVCLGVGISRCGVDGAGRAADVHAGHGGAGCVIGGRVCDTAIGQSADGAADGGVAGGSADEEERLLAGDRVDAILHDVNDLLVDLIIDLINVVVVVAVLRAVDAGLTQIPDEIAAKYDVVKDHRGIGMMQGLEFTVPVGDIIKKCMDEGLILINAGTNIIRFVPPLVITKDNVDEMICILDKCLGNN